MTRRKKQSIWKRKMNKHFWFSIMKSGLRLLACALLFKYNTYYAAIYFALAEVLGIIEEM